MKIINPTNKRLAVVYQGTPYAIEPEGSISGVREEVAEWWKEIHSFIVVTKDEKVKEETLTPVEEPEVDEFKVPDEVPVEEPVEAPVAKWTKKFKKK